MKNLLYFQSLGGEKKNLNNFTFYVIIHIITYRIKGVIVVAYQENELISATELAKKFGQVMSQIKEKSVEKIGVLKNNKLEAVVISTEEYEHLKMIEGLHSLSVDIPDDLSRYSEKIQKAIASGVSEKSHEEIFGALKKLYEA